MDLASTSWTSIQRVSRETFFFSAGFRLNYKCETCILAKSQKHSCSSSLNKTDLPFMLIHSDL